MSTHAVEDAPTDRAGHPAATPRSNHPKRRPLVRFVILTFAVSWSAWGIVLALGGDPNSGPVGFVLWLLGGFGPPIAAVVATRAGGQPQVRDLLRRLVRWRVGVGWYVTLALPLVVAMAAVSILGWPTSPDASLIRTALTVVPTFAIMALAGGGLEELGWRGYALPHLQARVGALPAAVGIGLVWAVWHLPLYAMVDTTQADSSFGWFTLQAVALSIILTWIHNGTGCSVLLPVLFHAAVNTFYSSVVTHVGLVDFARFEMTAALLMTGAAVTVVAVHPRLHHRGPHVSTPAVPDR